MYNLWLILLALVLKILVVAADDKQKNTSPETNSKNHALTVSVTKNNVASHHNITHIDKTENMLRSPNTNKYYEEHKKKKKPKKSPKRTVQKIIKKNRAKLRKLYFSQKVRETTSQPKTNYEKMYGQEEKQWREEQTTTQVNQRKKSKKFSPKGAGYHNSYQKFQKKDKRYKRGGLSRELYILKDLDEIEFLTKEDGDDVVKAHVKNFW